MSLRHEVRALRLFIDEQSDSDKLFELALALEQHHQSVKTTLLALALFILSQKGK